MEEGIQRAMRGFNPIRAIWWLFGSVRWAIAVIVLIVALSLLALFLPQMPEAARGDTLAEAQWVALQADKFGPLADWMHRVGLFDVFRSRWFAVLLGVLAVSSGIYVVGRFPGIWWRVTRPRKRVSDRYFGVAPHRAAYISPPDSGHALERALRDRLYGVERYEESGATYLFADRFRWAEIGTVFTHAAVVVFVIAAVVGQVGGFSRDVLIAEGESAPAFDQVAHPRQMQVQVLDSVGTFDHSGQPLDYQSQLVIFQGGRQVHTCTSTVNSPCSYGGYRFHQAAYFGFGAEVQVRDQATGNILFKETLALAETLPSPHVTVRDADGNLLLDDTIILAESVEGIYGRLVNIGPEHRPVWIGLEPEGDSERLLRVLRPPVRGEAINLVVPRNEQRQASGLLFRFNDIESAPATLEAAFPLPPTVGKGDDAVLAILKGVVYGSGDASAGTSVRAPYSDSTPVLTIVGLTPQPLSLEEGEAKSIGSYEYTFVGQKEFSGIEIKKDPSENVIWGASGLLLAGLALTFWIPRRTIWARIVGGKASIAGKGGHIAGFRREVQRLAMTVDAVDLQFQVDPGRVSKDGGSDSNR